MTRLLRDRRGAFGFVVLLVVVVCAIAAPLVTERRSRGSTRHRRYAVHSAAVQRRAWRLPFTRHGPVRPRRVDPARLRRADLHGRRVLAVLISLAIGVVVGGVAGYWRGPLSVTLLGLTDFALAVPRVVLLLLLAALWQPSTALVVTVLDWTGWMGIARLVHGEVRSLAARPFVEGAVAVGARRLRILARHILPNALTPVIVAAAPRRRQRNHFSRAGCRIWGSACRHPRRRGAT